MPGSGLNEDHKGVNVNTKETAFGALYLGTVAAASVTFGFGMALAIAKKKDPSFFTKGILHSKETPESGGALALRALGWGTVYAVSGFSLFCWGVWKALGVHNLEEFRNKCGSMLPRLTPTESKGRTEFKSIRDLLQYIIDEDKKKIK